MTKSQIYYVPSTDLAYITAAVKEINANVGSVHALS